MRLGLIGDVHAEDAFLASALERLSRESLDGILCTGDIADGRGDIERCVELLQKHQVMVVRGNHDRWCVAGEMRDLPRATVEPSDEARQYLTALPINRRLETPFGPLLLSHGLGVNDMINVADRLSLAYLVDTHGPQLRPDRRLGLDADIRIHVGGHTHHQWAEQVGILTMINAGTLRTGDDPGFGLLDLEAGLVQWFAFAEDGVVVEAERTLYRG